MTVLTPRIVRVALLAAGHAAAPSYVGDREWPPTPFDVLDGEPVVLATANLKVAVATAPPRVAILDARGEWLIREPADAGMSAEPAGDGSGRLRLRANLAFAGEQHFYGLGQGGGGLDRLGVTRQLWNTHLGHGPGSDMGVPLLLSSRGYAVFFDNPGDAVIAVGRSDGGVRIAYTAETGRLVWYVLMGGDLRGVMGEVAELLGHAPLPPRWALGYLQSTRHFRDTAELSELPAHPAREAHSLRCPHLPLDVWRGPGLEPGCGASRIPARAVAGTAGAAGATRGRSTSRSSPTNTPCSTRHRRSSPRPSRAATSCPRATSGERPRGRTIARASATSTSPTRPPAPGGGRPIARSPRWESGGWWLDGGEGPPAESTLHGGSGRLLHNVYDRLRHQAFAEGEAADRPDQRVFLLCRSGAAGMQRFGASCWSGDINNDFATLEAQIPLGLNTGLSGVPYWGTDVGGFFHPIPESGELYARWFQLGAFSPIFRSHGWVWREHVPWAHGSEVEAICRQYAELRYRLLPYTYTLAWQAHAQGLPLMRPLVMNYPDDPRVWGLGHQFLWGDDLLVAPVTREGATAWPVYLPAGAWYDFWTGARHEGPGGITVDAPLDRLPLFVRAGAIVPMGPVVQHTAERPLDEVTLLIYPDGASRFELYEDDGRTNAYRRGQYALTAVRMRRPGPER